MFPVLYSYTANDHCFASEHTSLRHAQPHFGSQPLRMRGVACLLAVSAFASGQASPVSDESLRTWKTRASVYAQRMYAMQLLMSGTALWAATIPVEQAVDIKRAQLSDKQDAAHISTRYTRAMLRQQMVGLHIWLWGRTYDQSLRLKGELARIKAGEKENKAAAEGVVLAATKEPAGKPKVMIGAAASSGASAADIAEPPTSADAASNVEATDSDLERSARARAAARRAAVVQLLEARPQTGGEGDGEQAEEALKEKGEKLVAQMNGVVKALRPVITSAAVHNSVSMNLEWAWASRMWGVVAYYKRAAEAPDSGVEEKEVAAIGTEFEYMTAEAIQALGMTTFKQAIAEVSHTVDVTIYQKDAPEEETLVPYFTYNWLVPMYRNPLSYLAAPFSNFVKFKYVKQLRERWSR